MIYAPLFHRLQAALAWSSQGGHPTFAPSGHHFLLPSFFHTLVTLVKAERSFAVVIRTFGADLPEVAQCITTFSRGLHPDFPARSEDSPGCGLTLEQLSTFHLDETNARWGMHSEEGLLVLRRYDRDLSDPMGAKGEGVEEYRGDELALVSWLERRGVKGMIGIRDDYWAWRNSGFRPYAGKPVWVTEGGGDAPAHHIFFDDNINPFVDDSIVAVRGRVLPQQAADSRQQAADIRQQTADSRQQTADDRQQMAFAPLSGQATLDLHGAVLVKVHPVEAILDRDYFVTQIERCEVRLGELRDDGSLKALIIGGGLTSSQ
jgi:hypothetical protein